MKKLNLFLMLVSVSGLFCFTKANDTTHHYDSSTTDYYCTKCKIKLLPASKEIWVDSNKDCSTCGGDGFTDGVDRNGKIIKNCIICSACEGSGKKKKMITIKYLYCPKCHMEYSYPK